MFFVQSSFTFESNKSKQLQRSKVQQYESLPIRIVLRLMCRYIIKAESNVIT